MINFMTWGFVQSVDGFKNAFVRAFFFVSYWFYVGSVDGLLLLIDVWADFSRVFFVLLIVQQGNDRLIFVPV